MVRATKVILVFLFAAFVSLPTLTLSQGGRGNKKALKSTLKQAKEHLRYEEYNQAIPAIENLLGSDPNSAYYNFWMGKCLYITYKKNQALSYFETVEKINPDVDKEFHYYYGLTLHYNLHYDRAISHYRADLNRYEPGSSEYVFIANRISQCNYAKKLSRKKDADQVKIDNMGDKINTPYSEHSPVISANDSILLFTARRPSSLGADDENFFFDEDIYISHNKDGEWTEGQNIGRPVNSKGHDATISLTADGQKLYLYRQKKAGGLYVTDFDTLGNKWKEPRAIKKPLNSKYYEASIAQSADSSTLFFTSDRPGGYGGRDIYMVRRAGTSDDWSEPLNVGPTINTEFDEDAPYLHPDGKTLYYSSNGPNSMGGFDIFVTEIDSSRESGWLEPLNMGPPVNTADDDIYFVLSADGKNGYYSSGKEGGYGEKDIYHIQFPYYPYPRRYYIVELAGLVQDELTLDTLSAMVMLVDDESNEILDSIFTGVDSASFYFILEPERSYSLQVRADGYAPTEASVTTPRLDEKDIYLKRNLFVAKPPVVVETPPRQPVFPEIMHIYYDFDQDALRPGSPEELDMVAQVLEQNPDLSVEIRSHTDWFGTYDYNVDLSMRRAQAAADYLRQTHDINPNRVLTSHFSENKPMNSNENDEGRQYNRRSEFRFVRNDAVVFGSVRLRPGVEGIVVDHTTPKGEPGYDNPNGEGSTISATTPDASTGEDDTAIQPSVSDAGIASTDLGEDNSPTPSADDRAGDVLVNGAAVSAEVKMAIEENAFRHIYFDFDKYGLRSTSVDQLQKILNILQLDSDLEVEIYGHTDSYGSVTYNQRLSDNRSGAALAWLQDQGVRTARITPAGFSELEPLDTNSNPSGRQNNRRVEFRIVKNGQVIARSLP